MNITRVRLPVDSVFQADDPWHNIDVFAPGQQGTFQPMETRRPTMTDRQLYFCAMFQVAIVCAFFAILFAMKSYFAFVERAAYLEGRYGLDHATAMMYAEQEVR